jgi:uncharacterized protein
MTLNGPSLHPVELPVQSDAVEFFGHPMVRSAHPTTIEVTKDAHLTINGDCIIGVRADKGLSDLSSGVRDALRSEGSAVTFTIVVPGKTFEFQAFGTSSLTLESVHEMVIRRSVYVCGRTLAVRAGAAAKDIPRDLVQTLRSPETKGLLRIEVRS